MSGEPSYVELGVPDVEVAKAFYPALLAWSVTDMDGGGSVQTDTLGIGLHGQDDDRHFEVFFAVDDLDVALRRLRDLGGSTVSEVREAPGFGRFVECRDDQEVRFGLHQRD